MDMRTACELAMNAVRLGKTPAAAVMREPHPLGNLATGCVPLPPGSGDLQGALEAARLWNREGWHVVGMDATTKHGQDIELWLIHVCELRMEFNPFAFDSPIIKCELREATLADKELVYEGQSETEVESEDQEEEEW